MQNIGKNKRKRLSAIVAKLIIVVTRLVSLLMNLEKVTANDTEWKHYKQFMMK